MALAFLLCGKFLGLTPHEVYLGPGRQGPPLLGLPPLPPLLLISRSRPPLGLYELLLFFSQA